MLLEGGRDQQPGPPRCHCGPGRRAGACSRLTIPKDARKASPYSITNHATVSLEAVG